MKTRKKVLAAFLACLMVLALLPTTALAADAEPVASITDADGNVNTYSTLQEAINAATNGQTVALLTDVTTTGNTWINTSGITLDLDGHMITAGYQCAICVGENVKTTVKNGSLSGGTFSTVYASEGATDLTLEDCTVTAAPGCGGIYDYGTKSTIALKNCDVTAEYFAVYHNGSTAGFTLNAENSTITSPSDEACAIYVSANSTNAVSQGRNHIALTGCTVTGPTGIEGKYTDMVLTNCDITATAEAPSFEQYNNGSTALGFAVVSTDNSMTPNSPKPSAIITINGGNYDGLIGLSKLAEVTEGYEEFREATYAVSGGSFSGDVSDYLTDDVQDVVYNTVIKPATCTTNGVGKLTKIENGVTSTSYYVILAAHKWTVDMENCVEATCGEAGKIAYKCSACTETKEELIEATGEHEWEETLVNATCAEPAMVQMVCKVCDAEGETIDVVGSKPLGHEIVETVSKAATCDEPGEMMITCARADECGYEAKNVEIPALGHTWNDGELVEADCVNGAGAKYTCTVCSETYVEEFTGDLAVPALGHKYEAVVTAPTCTEGGYTTYICSVCGDSYTADETEAVGDAHVETLTATLKAATCTTTGIGKYACELCGTSLGYKIIPANHSWNEGEVTTEATCTEAGVKTYTCTICDETKTEDIAAAGHSYDEGKTTKEATCGEAGEMTFTCLVCNESYTEEIPATGEHNYTETIVDATCTEPAMVGQVCSECGATNGELTVVEGSEALGHDWVLDETAEGSKAATCVEDGAAVYVCKNGCGETRTEIIPATGVHTEEYVRAKEATCVENGYTEGVKCSVCDEILFGMEPIAATGDHTIVTDEAVAATCAATGLTEGSHCSVCGEVLAAQEEVAIDPDAHNFELTTTLKEASCSTTGIGKYTCSNCGASRYQVIEVAHTWGEVKASTEATCTTDGEGTVICSECGATETRVIAATGHDYGDGEVTIAATCGTDGLKTFSCKNGCGKSYTEVIPASGEHTFVDDMVLDATCTEPAKVGRICSVCGAADGDVTEVGEPNGHKYTEEVTKEATCTEAGEKTLTCSVCGDSYTEKIEAKGHTAGEPEYTAATCTENGKSVVKCTVCGEVISEDDLGDVDPATGHTEVAMDDVAVTCAQDGSTGGVKCSVCGVTLVEPTVVPADPDAHNFELTTTLKEASCSTTGIGKYTCASCSATKYATIEKLPHTLDEENAEVTLAPTCTDEGVLTLTCSNCSEQVTQPIAATGHKWSTEKVAEDGSYVYIECENGCGEIEILQYIGCEHEETERLNAKEATCTEAGYTGDEVCTKCGETVTTGEEIAALGHTEEVVPGTEATCTESGLTDGVKCSVCGEILTAQEEIPALGHTPGETVKENVTVTTCTEGGSYDLVVYCAVCGAEISRETVTVEATGHTVVTDVAVAASCITTGLTEGSHCSVCGEVIVAQQIVPMTAHTEVTVPGYPATETEDGLTDGVKCPVCGTILVEQEVIPATGPVECQHEHTELRGAADATCGAAGYTGDTVCSDCGEVVSAGETIPATGIHQYVITDVQEDEDGNLIVEHTCTECGDTYTGGN